MKNSRSLLTLMALSLLTQSSPSFGDWEGIRNAISKPFKKADRCPDLMSAIGGTPKEQQQRVLQLLEEYLRRHLGVAELPAELTNIKIVAKVADRFIVKQSDGLKLVHTKGITATDFEVIPLVGSELATEPYYENGYYIIPTYTPIKTDAKFSQSHFKAEKAHYFNYVKKAEHNYFSTYHPNYERIPVANDRGMITTFGDRVILTQEAAPLKFAEIGGKISNAAMMSIEGMPVLKVEYAVERQEEVEKRTSFFYVNNLELKKLFDVSSKEKYKINRISSERVVFGVKRKTSDNEPLFEIQVFNDKGERLATKTVNEDIDPSGFTKLMEFSGLSVFSVGGITPFSRKSLIAMEGTSKETLSLAVYKDAEIVLNHSSFVVVRERRKRSNGEDTTYEFSVIPTKADPENVVHPLSIESAKSSFELSHVPDKLAQIDGLVAFKMKDGNNRDKTILYSTKTGQSLMVSSIDEVKSVKNNVVSLYVAKGTLDGVAGIFTVTSSGHFALTMADTEEENVPGIKKADSRDLYINNKKAMVPNHFGVKPHLSDIKISFKNDLDLFDVEMTPSTEKTGFSKANVLIKVVLQDKKQEDGEEKSTYQVLHDVLYDSYQVRQNNMSNVFIGKQVSAWSDKQDVLQKSGIVVINDKGLFSTRVPGRVTKVDFKKNFLNQRTDYKHLMAVSSEPWEPGPETFTDAYSLIHYGANGISTPKVLFNTYEYESNYHDFGAIALGAQQVDSYNAFTQGQSYIVLANASGIHLTPAPGKIVGLNVNPDFYGKRSTEQLVEVKTEGVKGNSFKTAKIVATLTPSGFKSTKVLYNPYTVKTSGFDSTEQVHVAEQTDKYSDDTKNQSVIHIERPSGQSATQSVSGKVSSLTQEKRFVKGQGNYNLTTTTVPVHFRLESENLAKNYELINGTEFLKDKDIELWVTRRLSNQNPRVVYFEHDRPGKINEIELSFKLKGEEEKSGDQDFDDFLRMVFGGGQKKESTNTNENDIQSVTREGDLLFIKTIASKGTVSKTYVYSLVKKKLMFMVPNMDKHIDLGEFRFYVGQPSAFNRSIVAVFNRETHDYITHFDFGRVRLDLTKPPKQEGNRLRFFTASGSSRVFNEETNSFDGFLPKNIKDLVKPVTDKLGENMNVTMFDRDHAPIIGRDNVLGKIQEALPMTAAKAGHTRAVLLKGENGSGKSDISREFVARYLEGNLTPSPDVNVVFLRIDGMKLRTDTKYVGTFDDKFKELYNLAEDLRDRGYRLVVLIDDLDLVRDAYKGADTFGNLKSVMETGMIDFFVTTTPKGYEYLLLHKSDFVSKFQVIDIPPKFEDEMLKDLKIYLARAYPNQNLIDDKLLAYMISRLQRMSHIRAFPGAAYELVNTVVSNVMDKCQGGPCVVTRTDINNGLAGQTGIPAMLLDPDIVPQVYRKMTDYLQSYVLGQDKAILEFADIFSGFAYNYIRSDKPIGIYLLPGPTGVGKTETVISVSKFLTGDTKILLKISGEDYPKGMDPNRAIEVKKQLVQHLRRYPFCLLLFDEIEKMDETVRQMLLSLADGFIVDENGNKVPSSLAIIFGTSNIGMAEIMAHETDVRVRDQNPNYLMSDDEVREHTSKSIRRFFKPEQQGRLRIVNYSRIVKEVARAILNNYLTNPTIDSVQVRFDRDNIALDYTNNALDRMIEIFFDAELGARKLADNVERYLVNAFLVPERRQGLIRPGPSAAVKNRYTVDFDKNLDGHKGRFVLIPDPKNR